MNCVAEEAFAAPADHGDLLDAYEALIAETKGGAVLETHKALLCRTADEIYYAARYMGLPVDAANARALVKHYLILMGMNPSTRLILASTANSRSAARI